MNKPYMALQPTELALLDAASRIYSARVALGTVPVGGEPAAFEAAVAESLSLARLIDESVMADKELD
jgi:hypothetical protein